MLLLTLLTISFPLHQEPAVIVVPRAASAVELRAAEELRDYTERITGERLEISDDSAPVPKRGVFLGSTAHTAGLLGEQPDLSRLGSDGFRLVARPPHLLVIASPSRGVLYGVYELLERYGGVGWYASWHTVVPKSESFSVPGDLDDTQVPAFSLRMPYWRDVKGDFAARLRANGSFQETGSRNGGAGFGFGGGLGVCHTFDTLLPARIHFQAHPEYYSYRRKSGRRMEKSTQLCLTNPEVLRLVTSNVLSRIRNDPGARCYGVSQNDNTNYCECEHCAAVDAEEGSHAGTMVRFVNAVAEAVEREFPGKLVETLAYEYTRKPPQKTRLRSNVMPCLCTSGCDFSQPIVKSPHADTKRFLEDINGWGSQTQQLYIWDYTTNFRHYPHEFPNVCSLQDNLRLFRDNHAIGILAQGDFAGWHASFGELKAWLLAKWMWNPDLSAEPLLQQFSEGYYGKAAAPLVRRYFDELYSEARNLADRATEDPLVMYADIRRTPPSDDLVVRGAQWWREAAAMARRENPECFYNVAMGSAALDYTLAMRHVYPRTRTDPKTKRSEPLLFLTGDTEKIARFTRAKEAAQRFEVSMKVSAARNRRFVLNEHWNAEWEGIVHGIAERPAPEAERLTLGARHFKLSGSNECQSVAVETARGGVAVRLANTHWNWCATFGLDQVEFDPGERITLSVRVWVDRAHRASSDGEAFSVGVYDRTAKASVGEVRVPVSRIQDGWAWYEVATLVPTRDQFIWIAPGRFDKAEGKEHPAVTAVYVDALELSRTRGRR